MLEHNIPWIKAVTQNSVKFQHYRRIRTEIRRVKQLCEAYPEGINNELLNQFILAIDESDLHKVKELSTEIEKLWSRRRYSGENLETLH